jgi:hypothetical protein
MRRPKFIDRDLVDQIVSFVHERCPCALEDRMFVPTFVAIVDTWMEKALAAPEAPQNAKGAAQHERGTT